MAAIMELEDGGGGEETQGAKLEAAWRASRTAWGLGEERARLHASLCIGLPPGLRQGRRRGPMSP